MSTLTINSVTPASGTVRPSRGVVGIRAMLHTRNTGLLLPPNASETVAEATTAVSLRILPIQ